MHSWALTLNSIVLNWPFGRPAARVLFQYKIPIQIGIMLIWCDLSVWAKSKNDGATLSIPNAFLNTSQYRVCHIVRCHVLRCHSTSSPYNYDDSSYDNISNWYLLCCSRFCFYVVCLLRWVWRTAIACKKCLSVRVSSVFCACCI